MSTRPPLIQTLSQWRQDSRYHLILEAMGLHSLEDDFFCNRDGCRYRFHIQEDICKASGKAFQLDSDQSDMQEDEFLLNYKDNERVALYCHIPWCIEECTYCYYWGRAEGLSKMTELMQYEQSHAELLDKQIGLRDRTVPTLYFGGGTPTVLPAGLLDETLGFWIEGFCDPSTEVSCEASVSTLDSRKFDILQHRGVNRLSIGVQAFDDSILNSVARSFDDARAREIVSEASQRFASVNVDLLYGLEGQTLDQWLASLEVAVQLGASSITLYRLEIRNDIRLHQYYVKAPERFPDELECQRMRLAGKQMLEAAGYSENLVGWFLRGVKDTVVYRERWQRQTPCIAFGPGVHNYGENHFYYNLNSREAYCGAITRNQLPIGGRYNMDIEQKVLLAAMVCWKSNCSIDFSELRNRFGHGPVTRLESALQPWKARGLLDIKGATVGLTEGGRALLEWMLDDLIEVLISSRESVLTENP